MDQHTHWNNIASKYEGEIFDVFRSDKNKILPAYFKKHSNKNRHAIDFGCGIGKAFPYLSPAFSSLLAIDISEECLAFAKKSPFANIAYKRQDLSRPSLKISPADFVFCCNVIMLPEIEKNFLMFKNISKALRPGGTALIVVPSLESVMFSSWQLIRWYRRENKKSTQIPATEFNYFKADKRDIIQGIIHIDNVPTKHYSAPEIYTLLPEAGLNVTALEKLEYGWDTEFEDPPAWMKAPYPWDWLIECKK